MNGYITVDFNGKEIGLRFAILANRLYGEYLDHNFKDENYKFSFTEDSLANLFYFGYVNDCSYNDKNAELTLGQFKEWTDELIVDENKLHIIKAISDCYADSKFTKKYVKSVEERTEEIKKKRVEIEKEIGITSNHFAMENLA